MAFYDFRAKDLRPIIFRIGFRDVVFDESLQTYVPNKEYSGEELAAYPFEAKITMHEISENNPVGNYLPFLSLTANEEYNEVVVNYDEVSRVRIVASAEWQKPGERFLSVWSTCIVVDLKEEGEKRINMIMDQVSIGREPLMAAVNFSPVVDPKLDVNRNINLSLELIRIDVGSKFLPGSWRMSHKINMDESLLLELPRGQWYYTVRSVEI